MEFRTIVDIEDPGFRIGPCEKVLFVGSCFATEMARRFEEEKYRTIANPFGVMYNPASVAHTVERMSHEELSDVKTAFITLGTNHVYILKETDEIVDNCEKRPASLFREDVLGVDDCVAYLVTSVARLHTANPDMHIVLTVSPIRYRKYGYHGSQLSKATLQLAIEKLISECSNLHASLTYFPTYEIVNDELRDYRFYKEDMLHPSDQAVAYIWQRLSDIYLSDEAKAFMKEWAPLKAVLNHRPFNPDSEEYRVLMDKTMLKVAELQKKYPNFAV